MKELSIEEKAKRYDELKVTAQELEHDGCFDKITLLDLFPELEESEDEKVRKELIQYFKNFTLNTFAGLDPKKIIAWLEKLGKQKPVDKIEPKFHEDEWVVTDKNNVVQIKAIENGKYVLENTMNFTVDYVDKCWRKWTIQDAKDGDVLAEDSCVFIIKKLNHDLTAKTYCCLHDDGDFELGSILRFDDTSTYPATKEQRDLLFQKMKEAGYEWDAEKKELKKIEQSPVDIRTTGYWHVEDVEQKSAWSEEDEKILDGIIEASTYHCYLNITDINWLKSLRPQNRWRPSEEQMHAFEQVYDWYNNNFAPSETLTSLYNDLKKLREE